MALLSLAAILLITGSWWALALWPLPDSAPAWLARTREVCFGSARDGLPNAGGWLLLVGEPAGMLLVLFTVWGNAVREGLRRLRGSRAGRVALGGTAVALLAGALAAGSRVREARATSFDPNPGNRGHAPVAVDDPAPALRLVDQRGEVLSLSAFRGRPVVVAFAFGHCETVCPAIVHDALEVRRRHATEGVAAIVVTLDPWRDTPSRLAVLAVGWGMAEDEFLLGGGIEEVEQTLDAWKIPRVRNRSTGDLIHPAVAYVVSRSGRLAWLTDGSARALEQALNGQR